MIDYITIAKNVTLWAVRYTIHYVKSIFGLRLILGLRLIQHAPRALQLPRPYDATTPDTELPKISIVTPSYNQAQFIERTINSIVQQHYPHLEYIVQDGHSKDHTADILRKYQNNLHYWESAPDNGQAHAINKGFMHTTGEIMAYLNSDDILLPGALAYVADYFKTHPTVDAVYGHRILINEFDQEIGRWVMPKHNPRVLAWADYVPQETLFWRRSLWEKVGGIDESFQFALDWDLLLRFQNAGASIVRLPRFLGAFRVHTQQKTAATIASTGLAEMTRLRKRCHGREVNDVEIGRHCMGYLLKHWTMRTLYRLVVLRY